MYNRSLFNRLLYGTNTFERSSETFTNLVRFNGFALDNQPTHTVLDLIDSAPTRDIISNKIPRADGEYVQADYFRQKTIIVKGILSMDTALELENAMDSMRKNLAKKEQELEIVRLGNLTTKRTYLATVTNYGDMFADRKPYHITMSPFTLVFACKEPFAKATDFTVASDELTVSPSNISISNEGTIDAYPEITANFSSATSITKIEVENTTTGKKISYTGTIVANDVIKFDHINMAVTKNGAEVDYDGIFFDVLYGQNTIKFTVTGSSFACTATVKWKKTYL